MVAVNAGGREIANPFQTRGDLRNLVAEMLQNRIPRRRGGDRNQQMRGFGKGWAKIGSGPYYSL